MFRHTIFALAIALLLPSLPLSAQPPHNKDRPGADRPGDDQSRPDAAPQQPAGVPPEEAPLNVKLPTLGGKQFWVDRRLLHDWRIQQHVVTGHCRLLDGKNARHAWGKFEVCQQKLESICREQKLPPMEGTVVLLVHGLFRSRASLDGMADTLRRQGGFTVLTFGYPTTRGTIDQHAASLAKVIEGLEGVERIHFVAHSLGNIVIRRYLSDAGRDAGRIGRTVMLGPPNHGATIAEKLVPVDVSGQIVGPAAAELARGWKQLEPRLATPPGEFGILAGGRGDDRGYNPIVPGDDDMVVRVASTRLAGARDFRRLPVLHTTMMNNSEVRQQVVRFLQEGYFESEPLRQPIRSDSAEPQPADREGPADESRPAANREERAGE